MSEDKKIKTLEELKVDYDSLSLYEKAILDYSSPYGSYDNIDFTIKLDVIKSGKDATEEIVFTPLSILSLKDMVEDWDFFDQISEDECRLYFSNLIDLGFFEVVEVSGEPNFRLTSFRLQTFIINNLDRLIAEVENQKTKVSNNELGNTLVTFRDGSR